MKIRHATPDDLPELVRMGLAFHALSCYADTFKADVPSFCQTISDLASKGSGVVLVAENDEGVCGMAAAAAAPHWFNSNLITGHELFWWVDESARGSRAGLMLMNGLEQWAKSIGCKVFSMASTANLTPESLGKLYRRKGYAPQDIYYSKVI